MRGKYYLFGVFVFYCFAGPNLSAAAFNSDASGLDEIIQIPDENNRCWLALDQSPPDVLCLAVLRSATVFTHLPVSANNFAIAFHKAVKHDNEMRVNV